MLCTEMLTLSFNILFGTKPLHYHDGESGRSFIWLVENVLFSFIWWKIVTNAIVRNHLIKFFNYFGKVREKF